MGLYDPLLTLDQKNQLRVVCPIFQAETPIAACFKLRDLVWRGERPTQRQGCQACMQAGKCPINNVVWDMIRKAPTNYDPYGSRTAKVVQFSDHDLERIARVVVPDLILSRYSLSDKEMLMIRRANAAAGNGFVKKGRPNAAVANDTPDLAQDDLPTVSRTVTRSVRKEPVKDADMDAARTGDMSAAINAIMKEELDGQS